MSLDLPEAFAMRMQDALGDQYDAFQQALALPPPISIRLNKMRNIQIPKGGTSMPMGKGRVLSSITPVFYAMILIFIPVHIMFKRRQVC
jgi:hypothetical protein